MCPETGAIFNLVLTKLKNIFGEFVDQFYKFAKTKLLFTL